MNIPEGFIPHDGGPCPVRGRQVDVIFDCGERGFIGPGGIDSSSVRWQWKYDIHPYPLAVVAYRLSDRDPGDEAA